MREKPLLSVSIITRNSESRLAESIAQARRFADEVVVGVDADSKDNTWNVATRFADTAYCFKHPNQLAPAHLLSFQYCRGQWILRLDDDEHMEPGFEQILPELLNTEMFTHYWLPRKWVVSLDPPEYMHLYPWYPDYQLRLIRNDPSLAWKPPRFHSGFQVAGPGAIDSRFSILHYEPLVCTPEMREKKLKMYREGGGVDVDVFSKDPFAEKAQARRLFQPVAPLQPVQSSHCQADGNVKTLAIQEFASWGCKFLEIDFPQKVTASQQVVVTIKVTNTGKMTWLPRQGMRWPLLAIAFHIKSESGKMIDFDGPRIEISSRVLPHETTTILGFFKAPAEPGNYILTWDMVSEFECWFEQCGSETFDTPMIVTQAI